MNPSADLVLNFYRARNITFCLPFKNQITHPPITNNMDIMNVPSRYKGAKKLKPFIETHIMIRKVMLGETLYAFTPKMALVLIAMFSPNLLLTSWEFIS